jgi:hypothetical protein
MDRKMELIRKLQNFKNIAKYKSFVSETFFNLDFFCENM